MAGVRGLIAQSDSFAEMASGAAVLDGLESQFTVFGATHLLVTGVPLPGRAIDSLIVRLKWGDLRLDRQSGNALAADDPVLRAAVAHRNGGRLWLENRDAALAGPSLLLDHLGAPGSRRLLLVPVCAFLPYQAVVVAGGAALDLDVKGRLAIGHFCVAAFARLFALDYLRPDRPGELSERERVVLELSAGGKTAGQISDILKISQRTVHAHLQNASEKLRARNKTQTVVEALRYGQITI